MGQLPQVNSEVGEMQSDEKALNLDQHMSGSVGYLEMDGGMDGKDK